jgi:site-specific DNA-adenine methylase
MTSPIKNYRSCLAYYGNKYKELNKIYPYIDNSKYDVFIDAFGGSGCVACNVKNNFKKIKVIYNDLCPIIYDILKLVKDKKEHLKLIDYLKTHKLTKEVFFSILNKKDINTIESFWLSMTSFRNLRTLPENRTIGKFPVGNIPKIKKNHELLQNVELMNKDAFNLIELYKNDPKVIIYIDPPYISKNQITQVYSKGFSREEYEELLQLLTRDDIQCNLLFHLDYNGYIYIHYRKYIKDVYAKNYSGAHTNKDCLQRYQCFLSNH